MHIFISAGEPSGDLHAANLAREIRRQCPDARISGFGGPCLRDAGAEVLFPLVDLAVMWFGRVLLKLPTFLDVLTMADRWFDEQKPDAVVLVDYPGLHWRIAERAKRFGIPVHYFVPPQIWAWAGWRVEKIKRWFDHVYCSLPFEPRWYRERGYDRATYIGHPFFDEIAHRWLDPSFLDRLNERDAPKLAILPGSRTQEITQNLPVMLKAADRVARERPDVRFHVACLRDRHRDLAMRALRDSGISADVPIEIHAGKTPEILRAADCALAVSGSVSLELMAEALPSVVLYHLNRIDLWIARPFIKSKYISLVNLLADEEIFPEYLTWMDASGPLAHHALQWLNDPRARAGVAAKLERLRDQAAKPGATAKAAEQILASLNVGSSPRVGD